MCSRRQSLSTPPRSFPPDECCELILNLRAPKSAWCTLPEGYTLRGLKYTTATGLPFARPICPKRAFQQRWQELFAPLELEPPVGTYLWVLPMGVRDNHKKYELQSLRWRTRTAVASTGPPFQNLRFRAEINLFWPKTALELAEGGQMKGNSGYSTHAVGLPRAKGPSTAL